MLWAQRKRRRKTTTESAQDESPESHKAKGSWIKSHFSRLSDEKLVPNNCVRVNNNAPQPGSGNGEANTTIRVETITTKQGEEGTAMHRESFTSKQKMSGSSVIKETHKESGKSSSTDEAIWAAVAACTKEIDTKGQHLANSMLQRATAYQHSGHLESKDVTPEELKALEEVEMKLKVNFLAHRENTIAGANHTHTFRGHSHHGHKSQQSHLRVASDGGRAGRKQGSQATTDPEAPEDPQREDRGGRSQEQPRAPH
uniref:Chromosome 10 open reading frame 62 n=1 Tax=Sciurus vulgaris TaxID=55149 RepID=A0A8D2D9E1_SCIVU